MYCVEDDLLDLDQVDLKVRRAGLKTVERLYRE